MKNLTLGLILILTIQNIYGAQWRWLPDPKESKLSFQK
jgi:hypothetical protein